jgi:small subunit ribosomal protein S20
LANTKSAQRQIRVSHRRNERNKSVRSQTKTLVGKAEDLILSKETGTAGEAVTAAVSYLDKTANKGVIHPNNAARRKSRLVKKLNIAQAEKS